MQDESGSGGAVSEVSASAVPLIDFSFEEEEEVICLLNFLIKIGGERLWTKYRLTSPPK